MTQKEGIKLFCSKCGANNAPGVGFCSNCGSPLNVQQPNVQPIYTNANQPVPGNGMGIASMVLGIVSLVLFCVWYLAIPCAIVGVILGAVAINKAKMVGAKNGMATAGIVCSVIAIAIALILIIFAVEVWKDLYML